MEGCCSEGVVPGTCCCCCCCAEEETSRACRGAMDAACCEGDMRGVDGSPAGEGELRAA